MCYHTMDLTGMLIIKARVGEEFRRVPIHNEDITYDELLLMLQRLFPTTISSTDEVVLKYKDEDGDLITIADGSDLMYAKAYSRILSITIFIKGREIPAVDIATVRSMRNELTTVRDRINRILDKLESCYPEPPKVEQQPQPPKQEAKPVLEEVKVDPAMTAEFDPLNNSRPNKQEVKPSQSIMNLTSMSSGTFPVKDVRQEPKSDNRQTVGTVIPQSSVQPSQPHAEPQPVQPSPQPVQPSPQPVQPSAQSAQPSPSQLSQIATQPAQHATGQLQVSGQAHYQHYIQTNEQNTPPSSLPMSPSGHQALQQQQYQQHYSSNTQYDRYVAQPQQNYYGTQPQPPTGSQPYYPGPPTGGATANNYPKYPGYPPQPYPNTSYPTNY